MKEHPNILWICTGQQRADTLRCYGNSFVSTPNIDALAGNGAQFLNAFVQSPASSPSRASFMTGRYPRTTRLRQNGQILPPDEKLISRLFVDAGYTAGLVGKFHMAPGDPKIAKTTEPRVDDGFTEFDWAHAPSDRWGLYSGYTRFLVEKGLHYRSEPHPGSRWVRRGMPEHATEAAWCATRAEQFIARQSGRPAPWFYLVNIVAPQHPFDPPENVLARYIDRLGTLPLPLAMGDDIKEKAEYRRVDSQRAHARVEGSPGGFGHDDMTETDHRMVRAAYWAMCGHVDQQVGRILDALEKSGQTELTIVVFMSDRGEMLGDHNIYLEGPYFYDAAIRVPLIIRYPGRVTPARHEQLFEMVDLAPTLLELAELPHYAGIQGEFASQWLARPLLAPLADTVYCEYYNAVPYDTHPAAQLTMLRTRTHKIVVDHAHADGELYDLISDPTETRNVWRDPAKLTLKTELLTQLMHRMAFTVDPLPQRLAEW